MTLDSMSLKFVYDGWDGYQTSLVRAIAPRSREELMYRPAADLRSVGEIAAHISFGRIDWFHRMGAPWSEELASKTAQLQRWGTPTDKSIVESASELVRWLETTWQMIDSTLSQWTVADLSKTFLQPYQGKTYAVSRQWTIWRIMTHDIHHGGQLAAMLYAQGIKILELGDLGGHLTDPPVVSQ